MLSCIEDNEAKLLGRVFSAPCFSHEVRGEKFYKFFVCSKRLSENEDVLSVTLSENLLNHTNIEEGDYVIIDGQFRSYNNYSGVGNKLILTLFARISLSKAVERSFRMFIATVYPCFVYPSGAVT